MKVYSIKSHPKNLRTKEAALPPTQLNPNAGSGIPACQVRWKWKRLVKQLRTMKKSNCYIKINYKIQNFHKTPDKIQLKVGNIDVRIIPEDP